MKKRLSSLLLLLFAAVSGTLSAAESGYGIIVGKSASTDGRVYLAHNAYAKGKRMLNIYNRPVPGAGCSGLWFEFPGLCYSDAHLNGQGVGTVVVPSLVRCSRTESERFYRMVDEVAASAASAASAAERMVAACMENRCKAGAAVLFADCAGGWVARSGESYPPSLLATADAFPQRSPVLPLEPGDYGQERAVRTDVGMLFR